MQDKLIKLLGFWIFFACFSCKSTVNYLNLDPKEALSEPAFSSTPKSTMALVKMFNGQGYSLRHSQTSSEQQRPLTLVKRLPRDLSSADAKLRRQAFLLTIIPLADFANREIQVEQKALQRLVTATDADKTSSNYQRWLDYFQKKYASRDLVKLQQTVSTTPTSLVVAQAILESDWGRSRFAQQGQALFGVHASKGQPGIKAKKSSVRVASYPSLLDSVRGYMKLLNTGKAFTDFRIQRFKNANDPQLAVNLTNALHGYSEIGRAYGKRLRLVMKQNQLRQYDQKSNAQVGQ